MINKKQYTRQGVTYTTIEDSNKVEAALTVNNEKFILNGIPAIQLMKNSYKYDKQVQLTVFNKIGSTQKVGRVPYATTYDRMEIFLNREIFEKMIAEYIKVVKQETI